MKSSKALLILEDGATFEGMPFGKAGETVGVTLFYTGVVGYQEVITDPSYAGTLTVLTYPIIGSYGINGEDSETPDVQVRGVVIKEYSGHVSNFRATGKLEEFLVERGIVGIRAVDTRAVAVHLREHGEMKGMIASGDIGSDEALRRLKKTHSPWEKDLTKDLKPPGVPEPVGAEKHRLAALNVGIKRSCLAQLAQLGCAVEILPVSADPEAILKTGSGGLIVAGGPGDPQLLTRAVDTIKALLGRIPILGVGLGHHLLALALGCTVRRLKTGHHGLNYPVRRVAEGTSEITIQHHSFVVEEESVPDAVQVTHRNVNDRTVEGIRSETFSAASVQFHPSPDEIGNANRLFVEFADTLHRKQRHLRTD